MNMTTMTYRDTQWSCPVRWWLPAECPCS